VFAASQVDVADVYRSCGGEVWRALLVVAGGRADLAEEATAEAFARYVRLRDKVREPRAWLYRTGFRLVLDELRRERRHTTADVTATAAEQAGFSDEFIQAMAALSPEQRLVTFLAYGMDLPLGEVARLTGSTVAGVKMRLHRARRALRERLKEDAGV
jgi:RNA polymerase sigma-70 factor (ECF subfamily)